MEKKYDVVLLTESRYYQPSKITPYIANVLKEDNLVKTALERKGLSVLRLDWADASFDWSSTKVALFRTTWDYHFRFSEFQSWLESTAKKTQILNLPSLLLWNMDKHYLTDLASQGINIPRTKYIDKGTDFSLTEIFKETGWQELILKPTVSGAARQTFRIAYADAEAMQATAQAAIDEENMLVQEFLEEVVTQGEVSLMCIQGKYTHAILKKAKQGDFRVQDDHGGTVHEYIPSKEEIDFAERVMGTFINTPLYGRVDIIKDNQGDSAVSELEIIEPEMWFRHYPPAADLLADALISKWL